MKAKDVINMAMKNNYLRLTWTSELSSRMTDEAKRKGFIVTKKVTSIVEIDRGPRKFLWGKYYLPAGVEDSIMTHQGKLYIRIKSLLPPEIQYYINGTKANRSDFEKYPMMKPDYWFNKDHTTVKNMILDIEKIDKMEGVVYDKNRNQILSNS